MIDYSKILTYFYDAEWILEGDSYEGLTWLSNSQKPSKSELDSKWDEVLEIIENKKQIEAAAKAAAEAKLAALGLTTDDLKALGLG